jgi:hypothetical protein
MDTETKNRIDEIISHLNNLKVTQPKAASASLMACLSVILAQEQEKAAVRMEQQTDRLVKQTDTLIRFTKGLYALTIALLVLGVIQLATMFFFRP